MFGYARSTLTATLFLVSTLAVSAAPVIADWETVGTGGFADGYATTITYDKNAARGTSNNRGNALNALGAADDSFFEIGFGSFIDLTFGAVFDTSVKLFEVTFGTVSSWPESVEVFVGDGIDFTSIGSISNAAAQDGGMVPIGLAGTFNTVRILDTSPTRGRSTGGFDLDAVRVTPVPVPAALPLLGAGLAVLGFFGWRRREEA
ncbi:PEP-CTERM sorting domain-containing protein [Roseibium album]|uniref:PEP-CTERM sorting domain-containing protein n=1 Tax=Roseibium album TaxID=311410 RepID=UPI00248FD687|nr:PEP-CTERM sorting domain-containing protein [Roseibium album]